MNKELDFVKPEGRRAFFAVVDGKDFGPYSSRANAEAALSVERRRLSNRMIGRAMSDNRLEEALAIAEQGFCNHG